ncbi:hypothetical protein EDL99_00280 [Ornithobacterium rhinotracheale]|uniref:CshA/CshB family fibrillar adhesin-related protein n=1 Tax=Ornithobacterium rhinotracheale TaxID=28251 RepID=UPI00129CFA44|nr:CshA/CshB family fibrillar adhesin-related protein [Ornithobacterium rhinotracheale]MRJ07321.1 hypothetical protein [Ornithobacterium rhinotracheale]UOH77922.1 CshA/CshB family fibrillar adhesin-related protein [Ornithobacterium rhinotracheale]
MRRIFLFIFCLFFIKNFAQNRFPDASVAPYGKSPYRENIYWVNWDINNNGLMDEIIINDLARPETIREFTTPNGMHYTIKLKVISHNDLLPSSMPLLKSYTPGNFPYDDLKSSFNWFVNGDNTAQDFEGCGVSSNGTYNTNFFNTKLNAHNSVIGIVGRDGDEIVCEVELIAQNQNGVRVSPEGIVVSGAESLAADRPNAIEFIEIENLTNNKPWRILEMPKNDYRGDNYTSLNEIKADVANQGKKVRWYNGAINNFSEGAGDILWYGEKVSKFRFSLKGGGKQAIAIGFYTLQNYGDAPKDLGENVGNQVTLSFKGETGVLQDGRKIAVKNTPLAVRTEFPFKLGKYLYTESRQVYSEDALGSRTLHPNEPDDDDGLVDYFLDKKGDNYELTLKVTASAKIPAYAAAWFDVNGDRAFGQNGAVQKYEYAQVQEIPANSENKALLFKFTFPTSAFQSPNGKNYLRLRIGGDKTELSPSDYATRISSGGETEDYLLALNHISGVVNLDDNDNGKQDEDEKLIHEGDFKMVLKHEASNRTFEFDVKNGKFDFYHRLISGQKYSLTLKAADAVAQQYSLGKLNPNPITDNPSPNQNAVLQPTKNAQNIGFYEWTKLPSQNEIKNANFNVFNYSCDLPRNQVHAKDYRIIVCQSENAINLAQYKDSITTSKNAQIKFYYSKENAFDDVNAIENDLAFNVENLQFPTSIYARVYNRKSCFEIAKISLFLTEESGTESLCVAPGHIFEIKDFYYNIRWNGLKGEDATNNNPSSHKVRITQPGTYHVSADASFSCHLDKTFEVKIEAPAPIIEEVKYNNGIVQILPKNTNYLYSNDGEHWQASNEFGYTRGEQVTFYAKYNEDFCSNEKANFDYFLEKPALDRMGPNTNIITPNGDGKNDVFVLKNLDLFDNFRVEIYDRYGKLLKSQKGGTYFEWDGTYRQHKLPSGTYWYLIYIDEKVQKKGEIIIKNY